MLVTTKEMLLDAQKNHYGVGAFNVENLEFVMAVLAAAEETKSPVIMQTTPGTIKTAGLDYFYGMVKAAAERATVPVALHLDQQLDEARAAERTRERAVAAADANLAKYEAGLRPDEVRAKKAARDAGAAALKALDYQIGTASILTAPADGVIRSRLLEPGDMASSAKRVYQLAVTNPKWVHAYVTETQLAFVREGAAALVTTDTTPPMRATVGFISPEAEFTPKTVQTQDLRTVLVYEVRLNVEDPENALRLGQPVTVDFAPAGAAAAPEGAR